MRHNGGPDSASSGGRSGFLVDAALLVGLGLFWAIYVWPIAVDEQRQGYDISRDVASAVNFQHGQFLSDPAYRGEQLWYPPLSPMLVAGIAYALDVEPASCYRISQLLFNALLPVGFFLFMRFSWGRRAAVLGTIAFLFAMPWWQEEVAHGQPSIHAVAWGWLALLLYVEQHRRASMPWALACGVFQGLSFWHHPIVPAVLAIAMVIQTLWMIPAYRKELEPRRCVRGVTRRMSVHLVATVFVAAPVLYFMLHGPIRNSFPREFVAAGVQSVRIALLGLNPWLWGMGLVGLILSVRRSDLGSRFLVSFLAVTVLAQVPSYLRLYGGSWTRDLPLMVPHDFQRLFQLSWAICIGIGIDGVIRVLVPRVRLLRDNRLSGAVLTAIACAITGAIGFVKAPANLRTYLSPYSMPASLQEAATWVRANTDINDVFACELDLAFRWLNAGTGRKVWLIPPGHTNHRVDWKHRARVLLTLREAPSPEQFWRIARENGIDYVVPSPNWTPLVIRRLTTGETDVTRYLALVHGRSGGVPIYRVREDVNSIRDTR